MQTGYRLRPYRGKPFQGDLRIRLGIVYCFAPHMVGMEAPHDMVLVGHAKRIGQQLERRRRQAAFYRMAIVRQQPRETGRVALQFGVGVGHQFQLAVVRQKMP